MAEISAMYSWQILGYNRFFEVKSITEEYKNCLNFLISPKL